jgi:hypothetical protein
VLIRDCTTIARAKLEILLKAYVDKILRASITPFVGF